MAAPSQGTSIEQAIPMVKYNGLNTNMAANFSGTTVDTSGNMSVAGTFASTGAVTLPASSTLTSPVITTGLTASGSAANDFSASTGTFKTSTGAVTIGPGAISLSGTPTVVTGKVLTVTDSAGLTIGGVIVANYEYVTSPTFAAAGFVNGTAYPIYTFPNDGTTWKAVFASLRTTTAGGASSTATIYFDASGTAPGGGTAQFAAAAIDGTANTVVNFATPVSTTSSAGMAISLKAGGAATTGLVGLVVTIALQRLS